MEPMCGSISEIHWPDLPYCLNGLMAGRMGYFFCVAVMVESRVPARTDSGSSSNRRFTSPGL
jgi:hypothetical protein